MINTTITGNLTADVELSYTAKGRALCKFCIASNRGENLTDFLNCVAWGEEAERIANGKYQKGSSVIASGQLTSKKGEGKHEGKTFWEATVWNLSFNGGRKKSDDVPTAAAMAQELGEEPEDYDVFADA